MHYRLMLFVTLFAFALAAQGCRDESNEPRSADDGDKSKINQKHEDFKEGLHETADSVEENVNEAHGKVKKGVKKAGDELGVRDEVTGSKPAGSAGSGSK